MTASGGKWSFSKATFCGGRKAGLESGKGNPMADELEQAEEIARKLAKSSSNFIYLTPADRAVMMVVMNNYRDLARRVTDLERKVYGTGDTVLGRGGS